MMWCISTADDDEICAGDLDALLSSLDGQDIRVVLVLRGVSLETAHRYHLVPIVASVVRVGRVGLSHARNAGLLRLSALGASPEDFVAFPDDDCTYPRGLVEDLFEVSHAYNSDFVCGSYGERGIADVSVERMTATDAFLRASSVGIFVKWGTLQKVGLFNEGLGVGSGNFDYGEDSDFAVRAWRVSTTPLLAPKIRVYHLEERDTTGRNRKGYLTIAALHLNMIAAWSLLARGILGAPIQDLLRSHRRHPLAISQAFGALSFTRLRVAYQQRSSARQAYSVPRSSSAHRPRLDRSSP